MKATKIENGKFSVSGVLDLTTSRGFGDMSAGLPEDFLAGNPAEVAATIALRYYHPVEALTTPESRAMVALAWYATGAERVVLSKQEFRRLERAVKRYASIASGHNAGNEQLARFVVRQAVARAKDEGLFETA